MDSPDRIGVFSTTLLLGVSDDALTPRLVRAVERCEARFPDSLGVSSARRFLRVARLAIGADLDS